jgi:hypothetical protein
MNESTQPDILREFDWVNPGFQETQPSSFCKTPRQKLIEIAALAVAAIESIDRKAGRHA